MRRGAQDQDRRVLCGTKTNGEYGGGTDADGGVVSPTITLQQAINFDFRNKLIFLFNGNKESDGEAINQL